MENSELPVELLHSHITATRCNLVMKCADCDLVLSIAVDKVPELALGVLPFLLVRCHIHLLTLLTSQQDLLPCPALSTRWSPSSLAPTGSSGILSCRPTSGPRANGLSLVPLVPLMNSTPGMRTMRRRSATSPCTSPLWSRLLLLTLWWSRRYGTTSRRITVPPVLAPHNYHSCWLASRSHDYENAEPLRVSQGCWLQVPC